MTSVRVHTVHRSARYVRAEWVVDLGAVGAVRVFGKVFRGGFRGGRVVDVGRLECAEGIVQCAARGAWGGVPIGPLPRGRMVEVICMRIHAGQATMARQVETARRVLSAL